MLYFRNCSECCILGTVLSVVLFVFFYFIVVILLIEKETFLLCLADSSVCFFCICYLFLHRGVHRLAFIWDLITLLLDMLPFMSTKYCFLKYYQVLTFSNFYISYSKLKHCRIMGLWTLDQHKSWPIWGVGSFFSGSRVSVTTKTTGISSF